MIISLFKKGNPEEPNNYKGLILILVLEKILMGVMLARLTLSCDKFLGLDQAGFRKREEAIAQVVTLTEIVQP